MTPNCPRCGAVARRQAYDSTPPDDEWVCGSIVRGIEFYQTQRCLDDSPPVTPQPEAKEERPMKPPMLLARTPLLNRPEWFRYRDYNGAWVSDVTTVSRELLIEIDRDFSDPAALAIYDRETSP